MDRMTLRKFGRIVRRVMETLPEAFAPYLDNVVVDVADEPDEELLKQAGLSDEEIADGETLLGFFDPFPVPDGGLEPGEVPHRLWIFKRPHEEEFPDPKRLRTEIRKTVVHELAHHFGWSDADLAKFDDDPDPFLDDNA